MVVKNKDDMIDDFDWRSLLLCHTILVIRQTDGEKRSTLQQPMFTIKRHLCSSNNNNNNNNTNNNNPIIIYHDETQLLFFVFANHSISTTFPHNFGPTNSNNNKSKQQICVVFGFNSSNHIDAGSRFIHQLTSSISSTNINFIIIRTQYITSSSIGHY